MAGNAEARVAVVHHLRQPDRGRAVAHDSVRTGRAHQLWIGRLAVLVEAELVEPVGEVRKVAVLPAGEFPVADQVQAVVIDCRTDAAVGGKVHRVSLIDVQDVVDDDRMVRGESAD